jgi:hypothetical protein
MNAVGFSGIAGIGWGAEFLNWIRFRFPDGRPLHGILVRLRQIVSQEI